MKRLLTFSLFALILTSCQPEGRVFSENKELSAKLQWLKKDVIEFKVPVDDISSPYDMSLTFRYTEGFRFKTLKVKVTETSPSGKEAVSEHELKIIDENGEYMGDPALDIWDSEHLIQPGKKYKEEGTYMYSIEQIMPVDALNFAMEIGIILDKAKE